MNSKPKEFWLRDDFKDTKHDFFSCQVCSRKPRTDIYEESDFKDSLHVIEYSAYDELLKKVDELEALANKWREYEKFLKRMYDSSRWKGGPMHVPEGDSK